MLINDELRERIREIEAQVCQLALEVTAARVSRIPPADHPCIERLREAIDTPNSLVTVQNDDLYRLLWNHSQVKARLRELTPALHQSHQDPGTKAG